MRLARLLPRPAAALVLAGLLSGCSTYGFFAYPPQVRGNRVDPDKLAELVPGTSTEADATALLGSPTMRASFDNKTWLYISEMTRPAIAGTQTVLDQNVVALTFDQKGVLQRIHTRGEADAERVGMVDRVTPSPGTDASFWQQLIGNIGKYGPGGSGLPRSSSPTSGNY